jgi:hypothetical protein
MFSWTVAGSLEASTMHSRWVIPVRRVVAAIVSAQSAAVPTGWIRHSNSGYSSGSRAVLGRPSTGT